MLFLIDGYNLLYAEGAIHGRAGPTGLEKARLGLLGMLKGAFGDEAGHVTVVFDGAKGPAGLEPEQDVSGIHVLFARTEEADDLIERLIRHDSAPRQMTVVSDDHRIKDAARHRRCPVLGCGDFLDLIERRRRQRPPPPRPGADTDKPEAVSRAETQHWLREFGDLENDPNFKEAFDPFDFEGHPPP